MNAIADRLRDLTRPTGEEELLSVDYPRPRLRVPPRLALVAVGLAGAVLVVAHGGAISALTCHLLGLDHHQYGILSGLKNTHWSQLTARPEFDASQPLSPLEFTPENVDRAQWYFDGWNMGGAVVGGAGADV